MHSFMTTAAYAPYLGYLWVTGQFSRPTAEFPYGLENAAAGLWALTAIAHLLSVFLGALIVIAAFVAAERLWGRRTGWLAAGFVGVAYPMFYYSRTANVDVPALAFVALALAAYADVLRNGVAVRRLVWLGVFAGCAVATKESHAPALIALPVMLCVQAVRESESGPVSWTTWRPILACGLAAILAFGLGSGVFVDPDRYMAHLAWTSQRMDALQEGRVAFMTVYPRTLSGHASLLVVLAGYLAAAMSLIGLLLAVGGLAWVAMRRSRALAMAIPAITYLAVLFWSSRSGQLRFVMPAMFPLLLFSARAVTLAHETGRRPLQAAGWLLAVWVLATGLLRGAALTDELIRDSRYAAAAWLETELATGDAVEYFGPSAKLPWLPEGVRLSLARPYESSTIAPDRSPAAISAIETGWAERRPRVIILMPDVSSRDGEPHNASCPPEVFQGLENGRYGYELAAFFETESLLPWVRRPDLDYPSVNPPIRIYRRIDSGD
jgi:4-amino-4-deoxy-L-arabinose transferase-like glycosyltransferase